MYDIERIQMAATLNDALALLEADPDAKLIAGGTDVLIQVREGKLAGRALISIHELPELKGIRLDENGDLVIGSGETFAAITRHPLIERYVPVLGCAVDQAGGPQLRNVATIGGNICNGATSADSAPTLLALDAQLRLASANGTRTVPLGEFYAGPGRVKLLQGEILTAIVIARAAYDGFTGAAIKYAMRRAMDIATLNCAVTLRMEGGAIARLKLAYGVAAPTPIRCPQAEAAAVGATIEDESLARIAEVAAGEISPRTSWRASRAFRLQLARELCVRAIRSAAGMKGGDDA